MNDISNLGGWSDLPFFQEDWPEIAGKLANDTRMILPPAHLTFAALGRTAPEKARVVILGQDPYPTPGHANGLAFSVAPEIALPRSLRNIFQEMQNDIGGHPTNGDLGHWADQGVMLLNTALSVPAGDAGAHSRLGWDRLARQVVQHLSGKPTAFLLWGNHARSFTSSITGKGHLVLESAHPSPLSARRGFFGSRPFSQINSWLAAQGHAEIDWIG